MTIPAAQRRALMSKDTSRQNKLWLVTAWAGRWLVEWKWKGVPMQSRMVFRFADGDEFAEAQSFDEDVVPTLKFGSDKK